MSSDTHVWLIFLYLCMYVYMYGQREREREREVCIHKVVQHIMSDWLAEIVIYVSRSGTFSMRLEI